MAKTPGRLARAFRQLSSVADIRQEVDELRKLLFQRRRPRIAVIGSSSTHCDGLLNALLGSKPAQLSLDGDRGSWIKIDAPGRKLEWLELDPKLFGTTTWRDAIDRQAPDVILLVVSSDRIAEDFEDLRQAWLSVTAALAGNTELPRSLAVVTRAEKEEAESERKAFGTLLREANMRVDPPRVVSLADGAGIAGLEEAILMVLPYAARVEGARTFVRATDGRRRVSAELVQACSTVSVAVAVTPIPLSDMAVIGPLQALMVSTLAYISGRPFSRKVIAEWVASLGVTGGVGLGLRWTAQQLAKFFPGAGNVVSAGVAGAGTTAIGRSAMAYFLKDKN